jgi:hypothetical protein
VALAAPVDVIDLDDARQLPVGITLEHGLQELLLEAPGRVVGNAELAHELHGGDSVLLLGEQIEGQKPGGEVNRKDLELKLSAVTSALLQDTGYISLIDVFVRLGYLTEKDIEAWRMKRVPYLEKCINLNLGKISFIVKTVRRNCINGKLKASYTGYKSWGKGPKIALQFSKSCHPHIEQAYSTHFVRPKSTA